MEKVVLEANVRDQFSKGVNNRLRKEGKVPGVFYSKHEDPLPIEVVEKNLNPLVFTSKTHLLSLKTNKGQEFDCIIKDIQFDPVTDRVVHFDLFGLTKGEKIQIEVPLQFKGAPVGIKEGGILQQVLHKLDVECFPKDIPQSLEIEISELKLGDAIHVRDLSFENIEILSAPEAVIVAVTHPKVEKVTAEEEAAAAPAEPEVIGKGKEKEETEE
jgi:large subunit ribosomal protein L25